MITTLAAILDLCALAAFAALTVALDEAERPHRPHRARRDRDPLLDDLELMADALATPSVTGSAPPTPDDPNQWITIDGRGYHGAIDITITNTLTDYYGDEMGPLDLTAGVGIEVVMKLDDIEQYRAIVGEADDRVHGHVELMTYGPHPEGRRCLWGTRRGYIQVGSPADQAALIRMTLPNVRFQNTATDQEHEPHA